MKYGMLEMFMGKIMKVKFRKAKPKKLKLLREINRSSSIRYRPELDGIRAIAVICVVLNHTQLLSWGYLGVDVFFVLSGYLITEILLQLQNSPSRMKKFYFGRITRLFPVLILYTLVGCVASFIFLKQWFNIYQPLAALLQIKNFFQLSESYRDLWAHTWSLSAEEQFYAVWPFLLFFYLKSIRKRYFLAIIIGYIIMAHMSLRIIDYLWTDITNQTHDYGASIIAVIIRPSEILIGCVLVLSRPFSRVIVAGLCAVATCGAEIIGLSQFLTTALATATLLVILEMSSDLNKKLHWFLGQKILVSIGVLSYSIYLWHALIGIIFFEYLGRGVQIKLMIIFLTLAISYISYTWFEIPIQKILKRRFIQR